MYTERTGMAAKCSLARGQVKCTRFLTAPPHASYDVAREVRVPETGSASGQPAGEMMKRKESGSARSLGKGGLYVEMPTQAKRQKETYMRASALAEGTPLSGKRVSDLMRRGSVEGVKVEGQWVGTRSAVSRYLSAGKDGVESRSGSSRSRGAR
jgi:hypothetical protein